MENRFVLLTLFFAFVASSCASGNSADAEGTAKARLEGTSTANSERVENESATAAAATETFLNEQATATQRYLQITNTALAESMRKTEQAQPLHSQILNLFEQDLITTTDGKYFNLPDFTESWAQIDWFLYSSARRSLENFIIRSDVTWDLASESSNQDAGCGFVFRERGDENMYVAYLSVGGQVTFSRWINDMWKDLGSTYYGNVGFPSGQAQVMLAVDGNRFTFFVDGKQVRTIIDEELDSGELHYMVHSGINTGFGTRCTFTNIELWEID